MTRRSMTAYGRASGGGYLIEIHSVNRKGLDINLNVPRELLFCDIEIRSCIKEKIFRGSVSVRISREKGESLDIELPPREALDSIADHFLKMGFETSEVSLSFLCEQYRQVSVAPEEPDSKGLLQGLESALDRLITMKEKEAHHLIDDVKTRLKGLQSGVKVLEKKAHSTPEALRRKLTERLKVLNISQEDVAKEVVLFAERADVTEELVRLRSHFDQFESMLKSKESAVGRTLDFLLVEMIRELNTVGAKAILHEMTDTVPLLKAEVEKIREQVQNIE